MCSSDRCYATSTPTPHSRRRPAPGHWNDPDYLGPDQGMSAAQFRTQFSMWAMLAAPLMVSDDLISLSSASVSTISNREAIAIDQDPAGLQARLLAAERQRPGLGQAAQRRLAGGRAAEPRLEHPADLDHHERRRNDARAWLRAAQRLDRHGLAPRLPRDDRGERSGRRDGLGKGRRDLIVLW